MKKIILSVLTVSVMIGVLASDLDVTGGKKDTFTKAASKASSFRSAMGGNGEKAFSDKYFDIRF